MLTINQSNSRPAGECRKRLAFALQGAYTARRYNSPALFDAVRDFVRSARHGGLSLEWVLVAIQDVIDAGMLPPLRDGERVAFSKPILRLAAQTYGHWHDAAETPDASNVDSAAPSSYGTTASARPRRTPHADVRV